MIVVTHLLGTGHLSRALTLGRAFVAGGHSTTIVSGGRPVPHFNTQGLEIIQLPPVASNGTDFTTLQGPDAAPATPAHLEARNRALLGCFDAQRPDVLITELFPFGRRILRAEFQSLLEAARAARTPVFASVRDILAPPSKPAKAVFADELVMAFYRGVLVHADPDVITLDQSWPVSSQLAPRLHYTGFVAPAPPSFPTARNQTVLISAGGSQVGRAIFDAAVEAATLRPDLYWHLLAGGDAAFREALSTRLPRNAKIEAPRPDFRALMAQAAASVSMCGYNTALDILQTGVPAVVVPFDADNEVEQGLRADALSALPALQVLRQTGLDAPRLVAALDTVLQQDRPPRVAGMNGAENTVRIIEQLLGQSRDAS